MIKKKLFFVIFAMLSISAVAVFGCSAKVSLPENTDKPVVLKDVEVREYKGEKLGSVNDFFENSIKGPQQVKMDGYRLEIKGMVQNPASLEYDKVVSGFRKYEKVVTLNCVEGWSVKILWEGALVKDVLDSAGVLPGAKTVIFKAYDGYTTSMPIEYIRDNNIILAYRMNSRDIPPDRGYPFQLVAESKWGYKWIKWVTGIEVSDDVDYEGFWESRGYSNQGDLDKDFFD